MQDGLMFRTTKLAYCFVEINVLGENTRFDLYHGKVGNST